MPAYDTALIPPVLALAGWTFVMELWLYAYRIPDLTTYKITLTPEADAASLNRQIPRHRQYPSDNFAHLHEQPTVFYAVALSLTALEGRVDGWSKAMAWGYVGARVVHSLLQATSGASMRRFQVFAGSSVLLLGLTVKGTLKVLSG